MRWNSNTIERVLSRCEKVAESGCWIFMGCTTDGYGKVEFHGRRVAVHRLFYEHFIGPIPDGLVLDHLCRVRCCANPWHLEIVTTAMNVLRGEGPPAKLARQTHCKNGHELRRSTTVYKTRTLTRRVCRTCKTIQQRARRALLGSLAKDQIL